MTERWRVGLALGAAVVCGLAALVSTSNNGVWFELPLVAALIPLTALVLRTAPRTAIALVLVPLVGSAVLQTGVGWWVVAPTTDGVPWLARNYLHATQFEPAFSLYDPRFATDRRDEQSTAARDWWRLSQAVEQRTSSLRRDGRVAFWLSGNTELFNTNTLYLAAQLHRRATAFNIPDTTLSAAERRADLTPTYVDSHGERTRRVLVIARHDHVVFTPDRDVDEFAAQAEAAGWRVTDEYPMPGGGVVQILQHEAR
jgi:hypothetical protein